MNGGMLTLGYIINQLAHNKRSMIPYRDSKLTRLLMESLGGNSKTVMFGVINPADNNYEETLNTLELVEKAKNVKNIVINENPKYSLLIQNKEEIERLKKLLEKMKEKEKREDDF